MAVFETKKASETYQLGKDLGQSLRLGKAAPGVARDKVKKDPSIIYSVIAKSRGRNRNRLILGLAGDLGSGKTTFVKGLARGLEVEAKITSPTYVFVRSYPLPPFAWGLTEKSILYHLDLYRLTRADQNPLLSLGLREVLDDRRGLVVIEWVERLIPKTIRPDLKILFEYGDKKTSRLIRIS